MADLLSSLETGMTRAVGAASCIRNQITIIEDYMKTQGRQDATASKSAEENPNIDPILQAAADAPGSFQQLQNEFHFKGDFASGVEGINTSMSQTADGQFQFQLPSELLGGWPWPFDMSHGFGFDMSHGFSSF